MLPAFRTEREGFSIPTFDVEVSDVEGFVEELREFQSTSSWGRWSTWGNLARRCQASERSPVTDVCEQTRQYRPDLPSPHLMSSPAMWKSS